MLIQERDRDVIRQRFTEQLVNPVTIDLYIRPDSGLIIPGRQQSPNSSSTTQQLLEEVAELSAKITLNIINVAADEDAAKLAGITMVPAIVLRGPDDGRVRFFGLPSGYEFGSLIEGITIVSQPEPPIDDVAAKVLDMLPEDLTVQVFVTPT